jgi:catechol 2,3-dioxygenase-like lactoylglutathione lyase family enzyme
MEFDERFCALDVPGSQVLILFVRGSNPQGTTLPGGTIPPHDGSGPVHIGFRVEANALSAWQSRLRERGIPVESLVKWPSGGASIYFRDPDGHLLELVTPGTWAVY